jgi:hypothetical protein
MDCLINGEPIQRSESRAHPALLGYENLTFLQKVALIENCGYGEYRDLDQVHAHPAFYNPMRHYQQENNPCIAPVRLSLNPLDPMHYGSDPAKSSGPDQMPAPGIRVMRKRATYQYQILPKEVTAQKTHNGTRTSTVPLRNSTITVQDKKRAQISRQVTTSVSTSSYTYYSKSLMGYRLRCWNRRKLLTDHARIVSTTKTQPRERLRMHVLRRLIFLPRSKMCQWPFLL